MALIIVSGTPGSGKTTFSKKLAHKLGYFYFDLNDYLKKHHLYEEFDEKRDCVVISINKVKSSVLRVINRLKTENKGIVIDSHLSHLFKIKTDFCIITKCNLKDLEKRLLSRDYSIEKVRENLDSEIFDVCFIESKELGYNPIIVETDKTYYISSIINLMNL